MTRIHPQFNLSVLPYFSNAEMLFAQLVDYAGAVWLDSGNTERHRYTQCRYDIIAIAPYRYVSSDLHHIQLLDESSKLIESRTGDPLAYLQEWLTQFTLPTSCDLPFVGGGIGYFSYDLGRYYHSLPSIAENDLNLPVLAVGIYDTALIIDHEQHKTWLIENSSFRNTHTIAEIYRAACSSLHVLPSLTPFKITQPFSSNMTENDYAHAFSRIQDYLRSGDCYQINLTQRFHAKYEGSLWLAYQHLRQHNPAPFAAYLSTPHTTLLSCSPERFLEVKENKFVRAEPIKGTLPRGKTKKEDERLAQELLSSEKNRAENIMIVDLLRNDLSQKCIAGTVEVPYLCALHSFPNVHHLISTITGILEPSQQPIDLLRACFPGGSITGAPKVHVMELIESLEPHRRSVYCGSIGYISTHGFMDTNIAIRTLITQDENLYCSAGGAIVIDSVLEEEYQESLKKIENMMRLLMNT